MLRWNAFVFVILIIGATCAFGKHVDSSKSCMDDSSDSSDNSSQDSHESHESHESHPMLECGEHEKYSICANPCPVSCATKTPVFCTLRCSVGCECIEGYIKDYDGKCVLPEHCHPGPPTSDEYHEGKYV